MRSLCLRHGRGSTKTWSLHNRQRTVFSTFFCTTCFKFLRTICFDLHSVVSLWCITAGRSSERCHILIQWMRRRPLLSGYQPFSREICDDTQLASSPKLSQFCVTNTLSCQAFKLIDESIITFKLSRVFHTGSPMFIRWHFGTDFPCRWQLFGLNRVDLPWSKSRQELITFKL